jgi:hypothetical protein
MSDHRFKGCCTVCKWHDILSERKVRLPTVSAAMHDELKNGTSSRIQRQSLFWVNTKSMMHQQQKSWPPASESLITALTGAPHASTRVCFRAEVNQFSGATFGHAPPYWGSMRSSSIMPNGRRIKSTTYMISNVVNGKCNAVGGCLRHCAMTINSLSVWPSNDFVNNHSSDCQFSAPRTFYLNAEGPHSISAGRKLDLIPWVSVAQSAEARVLFW